MSNEASTLNDSQLANVEKTESDITAVLAACNIDTIRTMSTLRQSVELATGLQRLREILSDAVMKKIFMPLKNSRLGFTTDERAGQQPYSVDDIREALIEGLIRGLRPVGNEICVISGQCYAAVNGVERLVQSYPGLTDLWLMPEVPQLAQDGKSAYVPFTATWRLNGVQMEMRKVVEKRDDGTIADARIPVKVNAGMGPDAIIGKARRKMLFAIYQRITNSSFSLRDHEDALDTIGVTVPSSTAPQITSPDQDGRRMHLGSLKKRQEKQESVPAEAPKTDTEIDRGTNPDNY